MCCHHEIRLVDEKMSLPDHHHHQESLLYHQIIITQWPDVLKMHSYWFIIFPFKASGKKKKHILN